MKKLFAAVFYLATLFSASAQTLSTGGAPTGTAGGSLSGTYPNPGLGAAVATTSIVTPLLGVGNASPKSPLDINSNLTSSPALTISTSLARLQAVDAAVGGMEFASYGASPANILAGVVAGNTAASPAVTPSSKNMLSVRGYGFNGTTFQLGGLIAIHSVNQWAAGDQSTQVDTYTTPSTSTTLTLATQVFASGGFGIGASATDPLVGGLSITGQQFMPSITTSSAAQTGTVCWTTGTGKFTVDTTVGCLTSIMGAKNITEKLNPARALDIASRLNPFAFRYKQGYGDSGHYEQFGLGAEEVALVDERLVGRDPEGALSGVRYQEMTAVLAGAIQQLKSDSDNLRVCQQDWKCRIFGFGK